MRHKIILPEKQKTSKKPQLVRLNFFQKKKTKKSSFCRRTWRRTFEVRYDVEKQKRYEQHCRNDQKQIVVQVERKPRRFRNCCEIKTSESMLPQFLNQNYMLPKIYQLMSYIKRHWDCETVGKQNFYDNLLFMEHQIPKNSHEKWKSSKKELFVLIAESSVKSAHSSFSSLL